MQIWKGSVGSAVEVRVEGAGLQGVSSAVLRVRVPEGGAVQEWPCSVVARDAGGVTLRHVILAGETDATGEGWLLPVLSGGAWGERVGVSIVDPLP